mmetsp:Transcript_69490/g.219970  ORF Transcript_69490/g.219970 Transcript_69490/m.219970 type:complete len:282 (+) Transcript_69490:570-1415(+)
MPLRGPPAHRLGAGLALGDHSGALGRADHRLERVRDERPGHYVIFDEPLEARYDVIASAPGQPRDALSKASAALGAHLVDRRGDREADRCRDPRRLFQGDVAHHLASLEPPGLCPVEAPTRAVPGVDALHIGPHLGPPIPIQVRPRAVKDPPSEASHVGVPAGVRIPPLPAKHILLECADVHLASGGAPLTLAVDAAAARLAVVARAVRELGADALGGRCRPRGACGRPHHAGGSEAAGGQSGARRERHRALEAGRGLEGHLAAGGAAALWSGEGGARRAR